MPDGRSSTVDGPSELFVVDFPTLGWLAAEWVKAHCRIADGWSITKGPDFCAACAEALGHETYRRTA